MRLIDADKLKQHYKWWENGEETREQKEIFDTIVDLQPAVFAEWDFADRLIGAIAYAICECDAYVSDERRAEFWASVKKDIEKIETGLREIKYDLFEAHESEDDNE